MYVNPNSMLLFVDAGKVAGAPLKLLCSSLKLNEKAEPAVNLSCMFDKSTTTLPSVVTGEAELIVYPTLLNPLLDNALKPISVLLTSTV